MYENFEINTIDLNKKYHTVWDFGCSYTNYRWLTWSDMITLNGQAQTVNKSSYPGSGIKHVYNQLRHVVHNHEFTSDDLVLVNLPSLTRWDILTAYPEATDWSARGDFEMVHSLDNLDLYLPEDIYGSPKFHLADQFMTGYNYLEHTLQLFNQIECDKVIINTDPYGWNMHQRINHSDEKLVTHLNDSYDIQTGKNLLKVFMEIGKEYGNLSPLLDRIPNYSNYILEYQAEKSQELEGGWVTDQDPHPSPKCVYNFIKYYIFDGKDSEKLIDIITDSHTNWLECWQWMHDNDFNYSQDTLPDINDIDRDETIPTFKDLVWYMDGNTNSDTYAAERSYWPVKWPCHTVFRDIEW